MVKKCNFALCLSLLFVFVWCCSIASADARQPGKNKFIFMDEPLPPFSIGETGSLSREGISYEMLSLIFGEIGADFEIELVPWGRAIKSVTHGKIDGVPLLMKNSEREQFLVFSVPLFEIKELIYYMPERFPDFHWESLDDLAGKTIGLIIGYTYSPDILEAINKKKFKVLYSTDTESCLVKLLAGRVDLFIENEASVQEFFKSNAEWRERIKSADHAVSRCYWHMGISKLSPLASRMDEINSAIRKMKDDGRFARIVAPIK
ncbi:transporter substrate-binding domain-containing protein [Maridesulfovibrio sp.]|uniref:substrate-binding periplasmic protein n=1 Tax=Maridesulfovibrio sp. TaxID=2795000 RepID=UPI0029F4DA4D|nr:transporter substrate-binding domain-containing protein [Maridesulfovibrio sp.]